MAWGYGQASDVTVRDLATVGVGGDAIRVRISNVFGDAPLVIAAASVGLSASGPAVVPGTLRTLRFDGARGAKVPVGGVIYSDPVMTRVAAMQTLAISVYESGRELVTVHLSLAVGDLAVVAARHDDHHIGLRGADLLPGALLGVLAREAEHVLAARVIDQLGRPVTGHERRVQPLEGDHP